MSTRARESEPDPRVTRSRAVILRAAVDELAAVCLLGALFYSRLMSPDPFDPDRAGELVDAVLPADRRG